MMRQQPVPRAEPQPELPRAEPEIIPPGADFRSAPHLGRAAFADHATRIHVVRPGPVGFAVLLLMAGLLAAAGLVMLLGAALVGLAVTGVVIASAVISRLVRGAFRR